STPGLEAGRLSTEPPLPSESARLRNRVGTGKRRGVRLANYGDRRWSRALREAPGSIESVKGGLSSERPGLAPPMGKPDRVRGPDSRPGYRARPGFQSCADRCPPFPRVSGLLRRHG